MFYHLPYCIGKSDGRRLSADKRGTIARGFTLIELLVVITIIGILIAILLPALRRAKAEVQVVGCLNNLRTLAATQTLYQADNKEFFTPGYAFLDGINFYIGASQVETDWRTWMADSTKGIKRGRRGYQYKCPSVGAWSAISGVYSTSVVSTRPFRVGAFDYGANSALHGVGGGPDFSLYAQQIGRRNNISGMGLFSFWRRTNEVPQPSRTIDMADGVGGVPRMDPSSSVMSYPHRIGDGRYGRKTKTTVINYADAHAKAWDIDASYVNTNANAHDNVISWWVTSKKYCVWY